MITENVSSLQIHKLSQAQYNAALAAGTLNENALYLTPDADGTAIPTKVSDLENDAGYVTADAIPSPATATGTTSGVVKLSDAIDSDSGVSGGVAATPLAVKSAVYESTKPTLGGELNSYTWGQIAVFAEDDSYTASDFTYMIGQTKNVTIEGYGNVPFQLVGVGHDTVSDGSIARFTFIAEEIITEHCINEEDTAYGGWASTDLRSWLLSDIYPAIEDDVRILIKQVEKKYYTYYNSSSYELAGLTTCNDYIWVPSTTEVVGSYEAGTIYQFYAEGGTRIKYNLNSATANEWLLRSIYDEYSRFSCIDKEGSRYFANTGSGYSYGVAPCFCI